MARCSVLELADGGVEISRCFGFEFLLDVKLQLGRDLERAAPQSFRLLSGHTIVAQRISFLFFFSRFGVILFGITARVAWPLRPQTAVTDRWCIDDTIGPAMRRCEASDRAAAYTTGILRDHPFIGNKRTGFLVGVLFLELNGYRFTATEEDASQAVLRLASGRIDETGFTAWLRANVTRELEELSHEPGSPI